jgi:hypothetical protein
MDSADISREQIELMDQIFKDINGSKRTGAAAKN